MAFPSLSGLVARHPAMFYAATWTAVATAAVSVAAFVPELAFIWAVTPGTPLATACRSTGRPGTPCACPPRCSAGPPSTRPCRSCSPPRWCPAPFGSRKLSGCGRRRTTTTARGLQWFELSCIA
ncbi:hypothetical protein ABZP36_026223 [Zizania latifolia]